MKKKIFTAITVVAAVSGIAGFKAQRHESSFNALALANIEALTDNETESKSCPGGPKECARIITSPNKVHIFYEK